MEGKYFVHLDEEKSVLCVDFRVFVPRNFVKFH